MIKSKYGVWPAIINLGIAATVLVYLLVYLSHVPLARVIVVIAGLSVILQLLYVFGGYARLQKIYFSIAAIHVLYIALELITYLLFCLNVVRGDAQFLGGNIEASSAKWATYDAAVGYKGIPGNFRNVKYVEGKKVYDHTVRINQQGWFSKRDYVKAKHPSVKRYMVLGDSYSAGFNVPFPWPDQANNTMNTIEYYNFSMEGIGIDNWHHMFFNEVLEYEFDGVILAISNENDGIPDMDRRLMLMHSRDDGTYMGMFDSIPPANVFFDELLPDMLKGYPVYDRTELERIISQIDVETWHFQLKMPGYYFLHATLTVAQQVKAMMQYLQEFQAYQKSFKDRTRAYGPVEDLEDYTRKFPKAVLLKAITDKCKELHKKVVIVSIPDRYNTVDHMNRLPMNEEMKALAAGLGVDYYSGYHLFASLPTEVWENLYYQEDLHWNQYGVSVFSNQFANWMAKYSSAN